MVSLGEVSVKRRWLLWLLLILFVWVVVSRLTEIEKLLETLRQARWQWVLLAAMLQVLYYVLYTALYQSAFRTVEVESRLSELLPVMFASVFVSVATASGGAGGMALFVDDAARRGQSAARATAGTLLVAVSELGMFTGVLGIGLLYLFRCHDLQVYEVIAAAILLLLIAAQSGFLLLGLWQPESLRRLLGWLQQAINRLGGWFKHPTLVANDWAERTAAEFAQAALAVFANPQGLGRTLVIALLIHVVDLASLQALFVAFHQPVGIGVLVTGYAVGMLFWLVAVTPQGIGVVEGVMALVFTSLGVPVARASLITLAFRGLGLWLPLAVGFFLLRRVKSFGTQERTRAELSSVRAVALLTALMGVVNVLSAVTPSLHHRLGLLQRWVPVQVRQGAHLTAAVAGFALLLLAGSLWRRKRMAWWLTLILLLVSAVSHLVKGIDYEEFALSAALALWLWSLRSHFHARSDAPSFRQGVRALVAALLFTLAYGTAGFYLLDRHYTVRFTLPAALVQTLTMFSQFYDPGLEPITGFGRYFAGSIYAVGAITLGYGLVMLLRPVLVRNPATAAERARAKSIVEALGQSSLARLALLDDKSYYFSPGGSVVAFVVEGRVAVALGDPIGPAHDAQAAIAEFQDYCGRNDWQPAFYQTLPDYLPYYHQAGFQVLPIGQEAIVHLGDLNLAGKAHKGLRSAVHKLTKLGYHTQLYPPPLADDLLHELRQISDEWLTTMKGTEQRFSLGWFDDDYVRSSPVMTLKTTDQVIVAFANIVPEYQRPEITIDLMRHRSGLEHGVMDVLFVALFDWARQQGYATFNLGLSGLSGVGEKPKDPAIERALHYIFEHVNQFYNFKGLHEFKAKFEPEWSPRYLIYPGVTSLPAVALALVRADSGSSFPVGHVSAR
jgi:phosphatidylglycerol lysyltransferase